MKTEQNIFDNLCKGLANLEDYYSPAKIAAVIIYENSLSAEMEDKLSEEDIDETELEELLKTEEFRAIIDGISEDSYQIIGNNRSYTVYTDCELSDMVDERVEDKLEELEEMFEKNDDHYLFLKVSDAIESALYDELDDRSYWGDLLESYYSSEDCEDIFVYAD
jgi:hypothetical protein